VTPPEAATFAFIQDASETETLAALIARFTACLEANGLDGAACMRLAGIGQPVQPRLLFGAGRFAWADRYEAERLHRIDPGAQAAFSALSPFSWAELRADPPDTGVEAMFAAFRSDGVASALVAPVHGAQGEVYSVTMTTAQEASFPDDMRRRLHVAASPFAVRGLTCLEREAEAPSAEITRRELQCIYWIAEGRSDWEIGRILDISEGTVAWHVRNAKTKLGRPKRSELPDAAWRRGLLPDDSTH